MKIIRTSVVAGCLLAASAFAHAQPVVGRDLVVSTAGQTEAGLYAISRDGSVFTTILTGMGPSFPNWVEMWPDNQDMAVLMTLSTGTTPSGLLRVDPFGNATSVSATVIGSPNHLALTEDSASFRFSSVQTNAVYDQPIAGGAYSTVMIVAPGFSNAMTLDPDTGDMIIGGSTSYPAAPTLPTPGTGFLLRYDNQGTLLNTIVTGILRVSGVCPDLEQGGFFVSRFDSPGILRVDGAGQVTTVLASAIRQNSVRVDADGTLWSVDVGGITRFDRQGTVLTSFQVPLSAPGLTGLAIYGDRRINAVGVAKPGSPLAIDLASRHLGEAGKNYVLAASFATRPGFRVAGRWVHLAVDNLFILTARNVLPTVFRNWSGALDVFGNAKASLVLPPGFPPNSGIRIHVQGVILDPAAPGGIASTTNTLHFTLQ